MRTLILQTPAVYAGLRGDYTMIEHTYPTLHEDVHLTMNLGVPSQPLRCWCPRAGVGEANAWSPPRQKIKCLAALEYAKWFILIEGEWPIHVAAGDSPPDIFVVKTRLKYEVMD